MSLDEGGNYVLRVSLVLLESVFSYVYSWLGKRSIGHGQAF
jgi:hypothetical protein